MPYPTLKVFNYCPYLFLVGEMPLSLGAFFLPLFAPRKMPLSEKMPRQKSPAKCPYTNAPIHNRAGKGPAGFCRSGTPEKRRAF